MSPQQAKVFYETTYNEVHEPDKFFKEQQSQNVGVYLRRYLNNTKTILDYGSGPGGKLASLVNEGFEVFVNDLNPRFVVYAQAHGLKKWDELGKYDCIFLSHTVEHWIEPFVDLSKLFSQNLKAGGCVIIEVPLVDRLVLGYRRAGFVEETHLAHVWYFSTAALAEMMRQLGFVLVFSDNVTTCVFRHFPNSGIPNRLLSKPWRTRLLLSIISVSRVSIFARVLQQINRLIGYIDIDFQKRPPMS